MATTRQQIDSRGKSLLQLLTDNQSEMASLMNPSSIDAGTYQGPDPNNPVDILYPRSVSSLGAELGDYSSYFLREFNLDGKDMNQFGDGGSGILTQREHDVEASKDSSGELREGGNEHLAGIATDVLPGGEKGYADALNNGRVPVLLAPDRSNFMKLKGRKSLLTLYWELRAAFVDSNNKGFHTGRGKDDAWKTYTNRYSGEGSQTYNDSFSRHTLDYYYPPSGSVDFGTAAANGFNLGQVLGPDISVIDSLMEKGIVLARDFIDRMISEAAAAGDVGSAYYYSGLSHVIFPSNNPDRVSQLFRPGWSRAQIPFNEVMPLKELLQQNLLLPPDIGISAIDAGGQSLEPTLSNTYAQLYLEGNRVRDPGYPLLDRSSQQGRFAKGAIAGTAINDLQEPLINPEGVVHVQGGNVKVPFKFEDDDKHYLTHSKKQAGFISNGPNVQSNPNAMESAVVDMSANAAETPNVFNVNARDVIGAGEGQYFPFTFSTVNKKNQRIQICTLQATIQSLSESFTPTWQSKHFFGRSEQVHTYTFTDRTIDLSFIIFADSMRQLQNVYERVLWLAQQCYPDYSSENRIGGGPIIALRIGDLIQHKAGFIRSLSYDWGFLGPGGKWELTRGTVMPQACSVTISYQIIHEKIPTRDYNFYGGPAGGLANGVARLQDATYGNEISDAGIEDVGGKERYIPTGQLATGNAVDQRSYLDVVDEDNSGLYNVDFNADGEDSETGSPPWLESGQVGLGGSRR